MMIDEGRETDALILPYLRAKDAEEARRILDALVSQQAHPIIKSVIARQTRTDGGRRANAGRLRGAEEIQDQTVVQLVARLEALRGDDSSGPEGSIADLRGYVAGLAFQNCQSWLRRLFPHRTRLRNRLRYILSRDPRFLLRPAPGEGWLCGLAGRDVGSLRNGGRQEAAVDPSVPPASTAAEAAGAPSVSSDPSPGELAALALDLLTRAGRPLDLEFLVDAAARCCGLEEPPDAGEDAGRGRVRPASRPPAARADAETAPDHRHLLKRIWEETLLLPPLQRSVLLLGLRDARGQGLLGLFPVTGVAGIRRIAIALGILPERFAELWRDLPLDDVAIAARLRLSRSQVIDLRRVALERLARRLQGE